MRTINAIFASHTRSSGKIMAKKAKKSMTYIEMAASAATKRKMA